MPVLSCAAWHPSKMLPRSLSFLGCSTSGRHVCVNTSAVVWTVRGQVQHNTAGATCSHITATSVGAAASSEPLAVADTLSFRVGLDDLGSVKGKVRLDAYLTSHIRTVSRAKLQSSIKCGRVTVNGRPQEKAAATLKVGDVVQCQLPQLAAVEAVPESIPLDIVFEDQHVIVINKAAGMVVHPSPGHAVGTLVNALLHHCSLPAMQLQVGETPPQSLDDMESTAEAAELGCYGSDDEISIDIEATGPAADSWAPVIRPGIVHRLDKGTTGLMVVAKDARTQWHLCDQFKARTVNRTYMSIVLGMPKEHQGRVETNIGRDLNDRKRMAAFAYYCNRGRHAESNYQVLEALADGAAALVQWKLNTGRTHQIRVHAKHIGHPLLCDDMYGGAGGTAMSHLGRGKAARILTTRQLLKTFTRPALHAQTLGFTHPITGAALQFSSDLPTDFLAAVQTLRNML